MIPILRNRQTYPGSIDFIEAMSANSFAIGLYGSVGRPFALSTWLFQLMLFGLLKEPESWKPCRPVLAILRPYSSWSRLQSCSTEASFAGFHLLTINISSCECSLKLNSYSKFSRLTPKLAWLLHAFQYFASLPSIGFAPSF
jgi:hypothetical protein